MVSRSKMFHAVHSIIGVLPALMIVILICWLCGFVSAVIFRLMLFLICIFLVAILLNPSPMPATSSAAPPACLDGFIVETNGGTGAAYTCTFTFP